MKLSTVFAKLTTGRTKIAGMLGGLAIAAAAMTVAAPAASAQVAFGVEVGAPRYYAPRPVYVAPGYGYGYGAPGYWERRRAEEWRAHEWREHEFFQHRDRDFYRDRDRGFYGRDRWR